MAAPATPSAAASGMVHQHFQLVPVFTVAENIMLGAEETHGPFLDAASGSAPHPRDVATAFGLAVDPDALVEDLPVGVQQRVEILKALYRKVDILILDEPTAVLTPAETDELLGVMQDLAAARARRSSSSPTSCARRSPCATRSPSCAAARSSARRRPPRPTGPGWPA